MGDLIELRAGNLPSFILIFDESDQLYPTKIGDTVPADIRVLSCSKHCSIDKSMLIGTAGIVSCTPEGTHQDYHRTHNLAFYKTVVKEGRLTGVVIATGIAVLHLAIFIIHE